MSTNELYLSDDEIKMLVDKAKVETDFLYGDEERELGISPYITFYIYHEIANSTLDQKNDDNFLDINEDYLPLCEKVIELFKKFEANIIDKPFKFIEIQNKGKGQKLYQPNLKKEDLPDLVELSKQMYKEGRMFFLEATSAEHKAQSARWAIQAIITDRYDMEYSTLKFNFGDEWYQNPENKKKWKQFVLNCLNTLQPELAYSGYGVGNTIGGVFGSFEGDITERIFADYFYGLDIDHPTQMGFHDHNGIGDLRPPTWCFLLSPYLLNKLGLNEPEIRAKLDDPQITITKIDHPTDPSKYSLWIQLGELSLYPAEDGVPDLLIKANQLIKPIRDNRMKLITLSAWDDDPNPHFDEESSPKWIARFDADSDWPEGKRVKPEPEQPLKKIPSVKGGERVPESGYWFTPAIENSRQYFNEGDIFPKYDLNDWGVVYWQWDGE